MLDFKTKEAFYLNSAHISGLKSNETKQVENVKFYFWASGSFLCNHSGAYLGNKYSCLMTRSRLIAINC